MDNAGVWLRTHVVEPEMTVLLDFSSPSPELSNYCSEKFTADMNAMGINSVKRIDGGNGITPAFGWAMGAEMILIGSITDLGGRRRLNLRTIACEDGAVLGYFSAPIKTDATLRTLLNYEHASRPRMLVTIPNSAAASRPAASTPTEGTP
jgi:hypothetical protein